MSVLKFVREQIAGTCFIVHKRNVFFILASLFCIFNTTNAQERNKKAFAHYMFQWGTGWISKCHLKPLIGEYNQLDPTVLEYHILLAFAARIDGFIMNPTFFEAGDQIQNQRMLALIDAAGKLNRQFPEFVFTNIFSYDDNNKDNGNADAIHRNHTWVRDNIVKHAQRRINYFRDNKTGKPVIMNWSDQGRANHYKSVGSLYGRDSVLFLVREATDFMNSDGNFPWIAMSDCPQLSDSLKCWGKRYLDNFTQRMGPAKSEAIVIGGVYPGFDDRIVRSWTPGGAWRYMKRVLPEGDVMSLTWDHFQQNAVKELGSSWVQIITWNDWPEGSSVEPATLQSEGYLSLETNRKRIADFKGVTNLPIDDSLGIRIPYEIFKLRKAGDNTKAEKVLEYFIKRQYTAAMQVARGMTALHSYKTRRMVPKAAWLSRRMDGKR